MTREQAEKIFNAFLDTAACTGTSESILIIMHELREALDKQVPEEMEHDGEREWTCPRCGTLLYHSRESKECLSDIFIYCPECGQRLEEEL